MGTVAPPKEIVRPRPDDGSIGSGAWLVTAYNNDYNTFEEVIEVLQAATGCTREEAEIETWEIHHFGSCVVHRASKQECERAARVISSIGVRTSVDPEE